MVFSLIIPCYNEEKNIKPMHDEIEKTFCSCDFEYEMVFVNDGSYDGTAKEIKKLINTSSSKILYLDFSRNFGKESAIFAGLEHCHGDFAVIIDGDLQQPPEVALKMLKILMDNPDTDCVTASQEKRIEGSFTGFLKKTFYKLINKMTEVNFVSDASDFRVMRRNMINAILSMKEGVRFSKGIFAWTGFHTKFIPYTARKRNAGETKWTMSSLFKYAFDGIVSFSTRLLKIPIWLSIMSFIASVSYLIVRLTQGHFSETSLVIFLILLMSSVVLFALSIVSVYLSKTYTESKHRPIYVLRDKDNN